MRRRGLGLAGAVLLAVACSSAPKLVLDSWEIQERIGSRVQAGMSRGEVFDILGEPSSRGSRFSGSAEFDSRAEGRMERGVYSECWYWGRGAVVCFGPDHTVVYKHAAGDSVPR